MRYFRRVEISLPLAIMPAAILILSVMFVHLQGGFRDDPDYGPFLNALNVLNFHSPGILEHPGTPVHIVGALVLGLGWLVRAPFVGFPRPDHDILAHPEQYLFYINFVFALMSAAATYYLGWRLRATTESLLVGLAGQASILFAYPVLVMLPHVTQEPLLISLTVLLAAVLTPVTFSTQTFHETGKYGATVGAIIGICIATKLIALPLLLSILFLRGRKIRLIALGFVPISFLVSTWPAHHLYPTMAQYWLEILTHTGHDGNGPEGILPFAMFLQNLKTLLLPGIGLLAPLALSFILVFSRAGSRTKSDCDFQRLFLLGGVILAAQLALVTKEPTFYYLVPGYAMAALVNAGALHLALRQDRARRYWALGGTVAAWLPTIGATLPMTVIYYTQYNITVRQNNALLAEAVASGCDIVSYYESPAKEYKLIFGTANIDRYDHILAKLYPHFLSYHVWRRRFQTFDQFLSHDAAVRLLQHQKCVYLLGSGIERFGSMGIGLPSSAMSLVARTYPPAGMFTAIYRLQPHAGLSWSNIVPLTK